MGCTGAIDVRIGTPAALGHLTLWQLHVAVAVFFSVNSLVKQKSYNMTVSLVLVHGSEVVNENSLYGRYSHLLCVMLPLNWVLAHC